MAQNPTATHNNAAVPGGACSPGEVEQNCGRPAVVDCSPLSPNVSEMFDAGGHNGRVGRGLLFQTHCKINQSFINVRSPP